MGSSPAASISATLSSSFLLVKLRLAELPSSVSATLSPGSPLLALPEEGEYDEEPWDSNVWMNPELSDHTLTVVEEDDDTEKSSRTTIAAQKLAPLRQAALLTLDFGSASKGFGPEKEEAG